MRNCFYEILKEEVLEERELSYRGTTLIACKKYVELYCSQLDKHYKYKYVDCDVIKHTGTTHLRECNDGGKLTAVNQAINQGKQFVDSLIQMGLYRN